MEGKIVKTTRDMDANTLFENHSVEEVRDIERKIRHDIEWKKEEMRDLVGERYRDLISAADTIKKMKECAEKVGERMKSMNDQCQRLREMGRGDAKLNINSAATVLQPGKSTEQRAVYEIACEIKLLLAVPGKIWNYLDTREYLPAAKLYLLAKHIHGCLQYDTQTGGQVVSRFPVISKQWAAISHFKIAIIQGCRKTLSDHTQSSQSIADALCCILLLEDKTPRQVFQDFLIARMFTTGKVSGVRNQITYAVQLIHNTVYQLTAVFCNKSDQDKGDDSGEKCNILADSLSQLLQRPLLEQLGISEFMSLGRHLPKTVTEYKPALRIQNVSLTEDYLKSSCDKWIQSCLENVRSSVKEQLAYVTTIKSLTGVKQAVWDIYIQDSRIKDWKSTCERIFTEPVNLWINDLSPLFSSRVQEIIVEHFNSALALTESQLKKSKQLIRTPSLAHSDSNRTVIQRESDMSAYIWCESPNDLPSMETWVTSAQKTFKDGGGLLMKAHGFTPVVQNFCSRLNDSMILLLTEVETYRQTQEVSEEVQSLLNNQDMISTSTAQCVSNETYQAVNRLSEIIQNELESTTKAESERSVLNRAACSWVLLLARFSKALPRLCPDLERSVTLHSVSQASADQSVRRSMLMSRSLSSKQAHVDPLWTQSVELLNSTASNCYSVWLRNTSDMITESFSTDISISDPAQALKNVTRWDDVEIQEETEEGKSVKSVISVPMQITWCLQHSLNELCKEINRVGSHALSRDVQSELVADVLLRILRVYHTCIENHLTQPLALQYMFDLWYLNGLLLWKNSLQSTEIERLYNQLIGTLQSKVDPFDLDVFTPHMQKHVTRQKSRNLVLFGAIADTEKVLTTSSRQTHGGRHEQHNVLPLHSSSGTRFSLLPIVNESLRNTSASLTKSTLASQTMSKAKNPGISKISSEPALKQSSSFYDRIGSGAMSWFTSNK